MMGSATPNGTGRGGGRRSRPCAATVHGRREIVQTLNIWEGAYEAPWAPFCGTQCAARFGLQAFRRVQNPALPAPMHETPCALPTAAPAGSDKPRSLSARYGLLLQEMSGSEAATLVRSAAAAKAARKYAPGTPGHPDWHPPGKPPPVPGVFRYDAGGYRLADTPEYLARKAEICARMREARAAKRAGKPIPYRKRQAGQVNGHHAP
jgi:hypothetical protein